MILKSLLAAAAAMSITVGALSGTVATPGGSAAPQAAFA